MANNSEVSQFVENKIFLIKKCIGINKDLMDAGDDVDSITSLIEQRGLVLKTLEDLSATTDPSIVNGCDQKQKDSINRMLTLLLDLDKELMAAMSETKSRMIASIKSNVNNRKVLNYASMDVNSSGTFLNLKK